MRSVVTVVAIPVVVGVGAFLYAWTGAYNIAATEPHWDLTYNFLDMIKDRSIASHSDDVRVPGLDDPGMRRHALPHYHGMCRYCHGAPGYTPNELAAGLYPAAPAMTEGHIQEEWNDAQLYWIIKNGVKLTGMPAFGSNHGETELWGLVALAKAIPAMTDEEYRQALKKVAGNQGRQNGRHHHSPDDDMHGQDREADPEKETGGHHH